MPAWFDWLIVGLLGGFIGGGELVSRYRDEPAKALVNIPAGLYVVVNAIAALAVLGLIRALSIPLGGQGSQPPPSDQVHWTQVLSAGFGAMALLRSSIFVVRAGDQDVAIGPSSFLQIVLSAADRAVDRLRAQQRAQSIGQRMAGISFDKAVVALPTFCLALMQNLSREDQEQFARQVSALRDVSMPNSIKVLNLGLLIINLMGEDVLAAAVDGLREHIKEG